MHICLLLLGMILLIVLIRCLKFTRDDYKVIVIAISTAVIAGIMVELVKSIFLSY